MNSTAITTTEISDSPAVREYFRSGNVAQLSTRELDFVLSKLCERYDLDPILRPFDLIAFRGGEKKIYMTASATNQLADKKRLSRKIIGIDIDTEKMIARCSVEVSDPSGRKEDSNAWISVGRFIAPTKEHPQMRRAMLEGDDFANAMLKLETKAKRRATMSFFGIMDSGADYEAGAQQNAIPDPFIDIVEEKAEPTKAPPKKLEETTPKEPKKPKKAVEKPEEKPPLAETKAEEEKIEKAVSAAVEEAEVLPPREKILYSRGEHAEHLIRTVSKILNDYTWTKSNPAIKEKVKNLIPQLDGKVFCLYQDSGDVCEDFEDALREKLK